MEVSAIWDDQNIGRVLVYINNSDGKKETFITGLIRVLNSDGEYLENNMRVNAAGQLVTSSDREHNYLLIKTPPQKFETIEISLSSRNDNSRLGIIIKSDMTCEVK